MSIEPQAQATPEVEDVTRAIFDQVMQVMGLNPPTLITRLLYPLFYLPIQRLSCLVVELDRNTAQYGWNQSMNHIMSHLATRVELQGVENIPKIGPLMVVCNHPAALDVGILAAAIPRDDLKILVSDIPVIQMLPHISPHSIPVYYDLSRRLETARHAVLHLENGGALFFFPRGNVEPDPAVSPGAVQSLKGWSHSAELFLRKAPKTLTIVAVASGMLSPGWYKNPLVQIWKKYEQRQKVAEIFQIASQLLTGKTPTATPTVRFSSPLTITDLGGAEAPGGALLASLVNRERSMLSSRPHD